MSQLANETCIPCRGGADPLSRSEAEAALRNLPGWELIDRDGVLRIRRTFSFDNFADAMAFSNAVADIAETAGHHPRIVTEWGQVSVDWWTHVIGGLHRNDLIMAARTDRC